MTNRLGEWDPITEFVRLLPGDRDGRCAADTWRVGGDYCPGLSRFRGAGDPRKWESRVGYAIDGATVVYLGRDVSEFSCDISIWTQTQLDEWKVFAQKYLKAPEPSQIGALPKKEHALSIYNPMLVTAGIAAVVVKNVTPFELVGDGLWGCSVEFMVFREPRSFTPFKPDGKIPDTAKKTPTADTEMQKQIAFLTAENKAIYDNLARGGK